MTDTLLERLDDDQFDALARLIDASVRQRFAQQMSRAAFLDWFAQEAPRCRPLQPTAGAPAQRWYRALGAVIFDTLPMPPGFRQGRSERPGRNDPCLCGSGQKYKQCCADFAAELDLSDYNLLRHVLHELPAAQGMDLVNSQIDTRALAEVVDDWCDDGDFARVATTLAPWFAEDSGKFNQSSVPLLGALASALLELERDDEARQLIARALAQGDRPLRAEAFRTRAYTHLDQADFDAAWEDFAEVRRLAPSDPSNATLELTILLMSKRYDDARARARYWLPRLERNTSRDADAPLEFVARVIDDPVTALDDEAPTREEYPEFDTLEALLASAPPVADAPPAALAATGELVLATDPALRRLETRWSDVYPVRKPVGQDLVQANDAAWDESAPWLAFLAATPEAWYSIEVLDDLVNAVAGLLGPDATDPLLDALVTRGAALVTAQVPLGTRPAGRLDWDIRENRAALRLLAFEALRSASVAGQPLGGDELIARVERLLVLDPADHFHLTGLVAGLLLQRGEPARVLKLAPPAADDGGARLSVVLALHLTGRDDEAQTMIAELAGEHAEMLALLVAEDPSPPRDMSVMSLAWSYRMVMRPIWADTGGLAWLGTVLAQA